MAIDKWMIRQTIDLARSGSGPKVWPEALLVNGDKQGHAWEITIAKDGKPANLAGAIITGFFNRADNKCVTVQGGASGNVATVTLSSECYAIPGPMVGIFRVEEPNGTIFTASVLRFIVEHGPSDSIVDPGHFIPSLADLLAQIEKMEQGTAAANTAAGAAGDAAAAAREETARVAEAREGMEQAFKEAEAAILAAGKWGNVTWTVFMMGPEDPPLLTVEDTETGKTAELRIPRGKTGLTPQLKIGTITPVDTVEEMDAQLAGTPEEPILNLWLARGLTGSIDNLLINGKPVVDGEIDLTAADVGAAAADHTHKAADVGAVDKAGDTMTGNLTVSRGTSAAKVAVVNGRGQVELMVDTNKGLYDRTKGDWMVYSNANGDVTLKGNADTATKLATPRKINGVEFDGSRDINPTPADVGAVDKKGDTMTGDLHLSRVAPRVYLDNTGTGRTLSIINNNTPNAGLYSDAEGKWIIRHDGSGNIHIPGVTWEAGDTFKIGVSATLNGMITSGSKNLHLLLSVGSAINASAVSVTEFTATLRGVAGYLDSDDSTRNLLDTPFTCSADIVDAHAGLIRLIITKSTAFGNVTNNTPVSLLAFSLSLKFS